MPVYKDDPYLQGLWLLEETSGPRADYSPNYNHLADNNTVGSSVDAQEGGRSADFEFDNSEYLSITDAAQSGLDITSDLSIVLWIKPESLPATVRYDLVSKYDFSISQRAYWARLEADGSLVFVLSDDGVNQAQARTPAGSIAAGSWYHLAFVYNSTDIRIYIDGSLASNGALNPLVYSDGIFNSSAPFYIANQQNVRYYDGLMDEAAVFSRALSAAEVEDIHTNGLQDPSLGELKAPILWHAFYLGQFEDVKFDPPVDLTLSQSTIDLCLSALILAENRHYWREQLRELNDSQWTKAEDFLTLAREELTA